MNSWNGSGPQVTRAQSSEVLVLSQIMPVHVWLENYYVPVILTLMFAGNMIRDCETHTFTWLSSMGIFYGAYSI